MAVRGDAPPWVIVAGGFHQHGGMDRANAALAAYLLEAGIPVHLVGHEIDERFTRDRLVTAHRVARPRGLPLLAERLLARSGMAAARRVTATAPLARVVVNGGNCPWPDVNWVHAVHAAWPVRDDGAAWWTRRRNRRLKAAAQRRERDALSRARVVIANSETTRRALVDRVNVPNDRVRIVYLGSDPAAGAAGPGERQRARAALQIADGAPVVAFVGALGTDINKGFDILWDAWKRLEETPGWDAQLVVAGGGWRVDGWRSEAEQRGSAAQFLGFTPHVDRVLAAADLLVSPVRYEAYGLNVHEALCRGAAVMVTRTAGVTERFDGATTEALLPEQLTAADLADRLRQWRRDVDGWRARAASTAGRLRARSWTDMAAELVGVVQQVPARIPA
jgi:glycosyltransferase involved in cell wall biosynthesis